MSNTTEPPRDINLEQQRKRAKELRRAHGASSVKGCAADHPSFSSRTQEQDAAQVLAAAPFTLSARRAQLVVAREAGFASMGHPEATTFLLERGADPTPRETSWNSIAAGMARWLKHDEIMQLIEEHGVSNPARR